MGGIKDLVVIIATIITAYKTILEIKKLKHPDKCSNFKKHHK